MFGGCLWIEFKRFLVGVQMFSDREGLLGGNLYGGAIHQAVFDHHSIAFELRSKLH